MNMGEDIRIPETMQAVVASGKGYENLALREVPIPEIGPNQLLARVDAAGVCTSNLKLIAQGADHSYMNGWDLAQSPIILGDEGAVTIVQVGSNLKDSYDIGQRCAVQPAVNIQPILNREKYRNNAEGMNKCAVGYTLGGLLAQYIRIQEEVLMADCLVTLSDNQLAFFEVAMAEPINCVYSAQSRHYHLLKDEPHAERRAHIGLKPGGIAVVRGAGVMGRMHAELALRFRPQVLIVADYKEERRTKTEKSIAKKAASAGCRLMCISPDDLVTVISEASGKKGADDFILALGVKDEQQRALEMLAHGGVANLFGGLPRGDHILSLDAIAVHYREIKVVGSSGGEPSDLEASLKAISDGDIDAGNYVAGVGSLDNAIDVLHMIEARSIDGRAILYPHICDMPLRRVEHWDKQRELELLNDRA